MPASRNRRFNYDLGIRERRCTQCHNWLPETSEHFSYNQNRDYYNAWCKPCVRLYRAGRTSTGVRSTGRRFGVEIEFIGSARNVAREMEAAGLSCQVQDYNHRVSRTTWKIVPDGSVSGGAELVSPILQGDDGFEQLVKASRALIAAGATVNRSTGLHVHHEATDLTVSAFRTLVTNYAECQDAIDQMVAPSRRNGGTIYCARIAPSTLANLRYLNSTDRREVSRLAASRYATLNLCSYAKYGTVEIRQHQGSVEHRKITAWVKFGQALFNAAVAGVELRYTDAHQLVDALAEHGLDDDTRDRLHRRITHLAELGNPQLTADV